MVCHLNKKKRWKTKGYCEPLLKRKTRKTKSGLDCKLPFKHNKQVFNDCIKTDEKPLGEWCKITDDGSVKGVNWDYCEETATKVEDSLWDGPENVFLHPGKGKPAY